MKTILNLLSAIGQTLVFIFIIIIFTVRFLPEAIYELIKIQRDEKRRFKNRNDNRD